MLVKLIKQSRRNYIKAALKSSLGVSPNEEEEVLMSQMTRIKEGKKVESDSEPMVVRQKESMLFLSNLPKTASYMGLIKIQSGH